VILGIGRHLYNIGGKLLNRDCMCVCVCNNIIIANCCWVTSYIMHNKLAW
jgi:hypothetical protein